MAFFLTLALAPLALGQGALTPPGAPAPTMKTLTQVEPRTDVLTLPSGSGGLHAITQPGSYYLTTNILGVPSGSICGISIYADNVTLDLNGFALLGNGDNYSGIWVYGAHTNVTILNGNISGWGNVGIFCDGGAQMRFERIMLAGNSSFGVYAPSVTQLSLVNCQALTNGNYGFDCGGNATFTGCCALGNRNVGFYGGTQTTLADCTASGNMGEGFSCGDNSLVNGCIATGNSGGFSCGGQCQVSGCTASGNTGEGFSVGLNCKIEDCIASANQTTGYDTGHRCKLLRCSALFNGGNGFYPFNTCIIQECTAISNAAWGIAASYQDCVVKDCLVVTNGMGGIQIGVRCVAENNTCNDNKGFGIEATGAENRIDSNHAMDNTNVGIVVDASNAYNLVVRNSAKCQNILINPYSVPSGNAYGPFVELTGQITAPATGWENFYYYTIP